MKAQARRLWALWKGHILTPGIPDADLNARLSQARQRLPAPVFWLLGKAQSGKTSIIHALTGSPRTAIGNGFQACTKTASFYGFPDNDAAFIRFLDTRGLAEAGYDPQEDIRWCEQQAHLLIVTVKAMDHQLDGVVQAIREIKRQHPDWPVVVAQTALHEGYPNPATPHRQPYPFGQESFAAGVPADLARSLLMQREYFAGLTAHFIPLDFTLPEDGFEPWDYGLDALWSAIEAVFPVGLLALLKQRETKRLLNDDYAHKAHPHIVSYAIAAGLAAALPVPAASLATATAVQAKLFHSIASIYGLPLSAKSLSEVLGAVGVGVLAGMGGRELTKLIPGYGQTVALGAAGLYTAAMTYALGRVFCLYFAETLQGRAFAAATLREFYRAEFERGRGVLANSLRDAKQ